MKPTVYEKTARVVIVDKNKTGYFICNENDIYKEKQDIWFITFKVFNETYKEVK